MNTQTIIFVLLSIVIFYVWSIRKYLQISCKLKGPTSLPFLGSLLFFLKQEDGLAKVANLFNNYGLRTRIWIFNKFIYCTNDPKELKIILNNEGSMEKASWFYYAGVPLLGESLLTAKVPVWRKQRRALNQAFSKGVLDLTVEQLYKKSETLVEKLRNFGEAPKDIYHFMYNFTLDSFCKNFFDFELGKLGEEYKLEERLLEHHSLAFQRMLRPWYALNSVYSITNSYKQLSDCIGSIFKFTSLIETKKLEDFSINGLNPDVKKRILIERLYDPCSNLDEKEAKDNLVTMILGGTESTALNLSFTALILGGHPEIQQSIHEEVLNVVGRKDPITIAHLSDLKYVERFIYEIMRLFPPIPMIARETVKDVDIGNYIIPKGSEIVTSIFNLHRTEKFWKEPLKFDPDRFLPDLAAKRDPYTYIPFSMGPRNCIGMKYAMIVAKVAIANLVRNFEFHSEFTSVDKIKVTGFIFVYVKDGFICGVKERP